MAHKELTMLLLNLLQHKKTQVPSKWKVKSFQPFVLSHMQPPNVWASGENKKEKSSQDTE